MSIGLFILRLVIGLLFMGHGAQKLFGMSGGGGLDGTGRQFQSIGLRPGRRNALIAGLGEFCGGLLVLLGWFTPLGAALIIAVMVAAIWTVHGKNGLWVTDGGFEYQLVVIAAVFALAGVGAGSWSLDHALSFADNGPAWAIAAAVIGALGGLGAVMSARGYEEPEHEQPERGRSPHATPA
jgi:putative oxidoreductase